MILADVRDHLAGEGFPVEVGRKPDDATDTLPYATVWQTSTMIDGSLGDLDSERDPLVHVKCIGNTWDQAHGLHVRLEARMRTLPGVMSVTLEQELGPERDDDRFPSPHSMYVDGYYRLTTTR